MSNLIYQKIADMMKEIKPISKDQTFSGAGRWKFRGIDDVYNTLQPLLAKHEVFAVPKVLESEYSTISSNGKNIFLCKFKVEYTFFTTDASSISVIVTGEGQDYSDKGTAKALSNAHKYALFQLFMIPTDENKDSDMSEEIKPVQASSELVKQAEQKGIYLKSMASEEQLNKYRELYKQKRYQEALDYAEQVEQEVIF